MNTKALQVFESIAAEAKEWWNGTKAQGAALTLVQCAKRNAPDLTSCLKNPRTQNPGD